MGRDSSIFMEHWCQGTGAKCPRTQGMGERHLSFSSRWELVGRRHLGSWGAVYLSWTRNSHRTVTCSYFDCCKCKPFPSCRGNAARGSRVEEPRQSARGRQRERERAQRRGGRGKQANLLCCTWRSAHSELVPEHYEPILRHGALRYCHVWLYKPTSEWVSRFRK